MYNLGLRCSLLDVHLNSILLAEVGAFPGHALDDSTRSSEVCAPAEHANAERVAPPLGARHREPERRPPRRRHRGQVRARAASAT